jgi:hypothetical protein
MLFLQKYRIYRLIKSINKYIFYTVKTTPVRGFSPPSRIRGKRETVL